MSKDVTELVFILDRSGSMTGLESDTVGGYNGMLEKQQHNPGEAFVTTVLFNDEYEVLHDRVSLKNVRQMSDKEYFVKGYTALLDAIGKTITKVKNAQALQATKQQSTQVIFVITTDGMENASTEYSVGKVRQMVEYQQREHGWEFIFLGANIDAVNTAEQFGINKDRAANYNADSEGTMLNFDVISDAVSNFRSHSAVGEDWKLRIDEDYKQRYKNKND